MTTMANPGAKSSSERIVCKFGGSSVADSSQFLKIREILSLDSRRKVVVVSAPGKRNPAETKLTDLLYSTHDLALKNLDISGPYSLIRERFAEIVLDLGLKHGVTEELDKLELELKSKPQDITLDYLVSRGEFLNGQIMAEFLGGTFIDAYDLIEFDSRFRVSDTGYENIGKAMDKEGIIVVPGFYGRNHKGELKTFSRGGSDITGSILANGINAAKYENWTDVSGLLMADPRIVESPLPMKYVSYKEIRELAYSGASVFHDEAIAPCRKKGIQVNIRNTNAPEDPGTIIGPTPEIAENTITGIAGRKDFSLIYLEKDMMNKEKGFGRKVLGILESNNISWEHAPTGIDSMSIVVDSDNLSKVEDELMHDLNRVLEPDKIKVFHGLALLAIVGHGMTQKVGVAAQVCSALAQGGINIRIIDQGSSEINIIIGVDNENFDKAINAIYSAFVQTH